MRSTPRAARQRWRLGAGRGGTQWCSDAGRMQTATGEIPLQLIREQPSRVYKCDWWIQSQWERVLQGEAVIFLSRNWKSCESIHGHFWITGLLISKCGAGRSSFHQLNSELPDASTWMYFCPSAEVFLYSSWTEQVKKIFIHTVYMFRPFSLLQLVQIIREMMHLPLN